MGDKKLRELELTWQGSGSRLDRAAYIREHLRVVSEDSPDTEPLLRTLLKKKDPNSFSVSQLIGKAIWRAERDMYLEAAALYEAAAERAEGEKHYWCAARAGRHFLLAGHFARARGHFEAVAGLDWRAAGFDFDWATSDGGFAGLLELLEATGDVEGFKTHFQKAREVHSKLGSEPFPRTHSTEDLLLGCCDRLGLSDQLGAVVKQALKGRPTNRALKKQIKALKTPVSPEAKVAPKPKPKPGRSGPMKSAEFRKYVTRYFAPKIRALGWKGSGYHYRKEHPSQPLVLFLGFRCSSGGLSFGFSYGFHPRVEFTSERFRLDLAKMKVENCILSKGFGGGGLGSSEEEARVAIEASWEAFETTALTDLASATLLMTDFERFEAAGGGITVPDEFAFSTPFVNPVGTEYLFLAEIARHLGLAAKTAEFCRGGLLWSKEREVQDYWDHLFKQIQST